jgi:hypothetical protein
MTERRDSEDEVSAIFERATEAQHRSPRPLPPADGMTLGDLQGIGREVGIPPALVAQAARALDHAGQPTSRRLLGLAIGVGRTIHLGRRLNDEEWERLVVDLRETFDARGAVRHDGSFRQWTHGNLQALLEPTPTGHRLRLRTLKGSARADGGHCGAPGARRGVRRAPPHRRSPAGGWNSAAAAVVLPSWDRESRQHP